MPNQAFSGSICSLIFCFSCTLTISEKASFKKEMTNAIGKCGRTTRRIHTITYEFGERG
jgi:hypothetical protein